MKGLELGVFADERNWFDDGTVNRDLAGWTSGSIFFFDFGFVS